MNSYISKNLNDAFDTYKNIKDDQTIIEQIKNISHICHECLLRAKKY